MKPSPLDYEIAKLIDEEGVGNVLEALRRETRERGHTVLARRLDKLCNWLAEPGSKRLEPAGGK